MVNVKINFKSYYQTINMNKMNNLKNQKSNCKNVIVAILLFIAFNQNLFAQSMGIGATTFTPDSSSILEVRSTSKGMLIPRMTTVQRDSIALPATGLFI